MKFVKGLILLVLAAAIVVGAFYVMDLYPDVFGGEDPEESKPIDVASGLTGPIYALENAVTEESLTDYEDYETGLFKEVVAYLKKHGGGKYTNAEGESVYVASTSSGGSYSSGGGGSYYYDDDDDYYYSGSSGGGGGGYDDGGSSGGGSGGYYVSFELDDTDYNYCSTCGTWYEGLGDCPNPNCPSNNW